MLVKKVHFVVTELLHFAIHQEECEQRWQESVLESQRLRAELKMANTYISLLEARLINAESMIDKEKQKLCEVESYISKLVRFSIKLIVTGIVCVTVIMKNCFFF
jgi:septal ring factor EnvC (AmiA/AmiB activator)